MNIFNEGRTASARSLRRSLAAVLLGLPLLFGLATEAAQAQVLISNIGKTGAGITGGNLSLDWAQAFTTGSHKPGYTMNSVDVVFRENSLDDLFRTNNPRLTVTIRNESNGIPGTTVGTLKLPASSPIFTSSRAITFAAPAKGIKLTPSTTYFLMIAADWAATSGNTKLWIVKSDDENVGGEAGFSIANDAINHWRFDGPAYWVPSSSGSMQISVKGKPNPITDLVQVRDKKRRKIAEFGNHKANGGVRVLVDIGDGLNPQGYARTINYTVDGTARRGDGKDYTIDGCTSSNCSVRLRANNHTVPITIYVNDDGLDEDDETIVLTLQDGSGYTVNKEKKTTTVTITDDDTRGLQFHRRWAYVDEGGSETYTVKLASQPTAAVTVNIVSSNQDVTVNPSSLTFNPSGSNLWSRARTVTIDAAQDSDAVDDTATLTYTTSGGDYGGANALSIERPVSVDDDDTASPTTSQLPVITVTGGAAVTEGNPASFTVNADRALTARLTVDVEVVEPDGQDFVAASEEGVRTVTLNAGASSTTFIVPTVNDNTGEEDGIVQVFVNDGTGYVAGQGDGVHVNDNDGPAPPPTTPVASFASASSSAAEDAGTHDVNVGLSPAAPSGGLSLGYSVTGTATAGSGNDFTIQSSGTLSVAAGETMATIPVVILDDSTDENAETVVLTLTADTGYTLGGATVHTLTITDNDDPPPGTPALVISRGTVSVTEGGTGSYMVELATAPTGTVTVNVVSDNAEVTVSPAPLTFHAGGSSKLWSTAQTVTVSAAQDSDAVDDTATLTHAASGGGYGTVTAASVTVEVRDDDDPPPSTSALMISQNTVSVTEGGTGSYMVELATAPTGTVTVNVVSDNAEVTVSPAPLTFHAGGSSKLWSTAQTVTVSAAQDSDAVDDTATLTHAASGGGYGTVTAASVTVEVGDDDPTPAVIPVVIPVVGIAGGDAITEGGTARFTLTATPAPAGSITVRVQVSSSNIRVPSGQEGMRTVTIGTGGTAPLTVTTTDDDTVEAGGSITAVVLSGTGAGYTVAAAPDDAASVGVVYHADSISKAWLSRFGRTVAEAALDGIAGRMAASRRAGVEGTLAGRALAFGSGSDGTGSVASGAASHPAALGAAGFPGTGLGTGSGADRLVSSETAGRSEWRTQAFGTTAERFGIGSGWEADPYGPGAARTLTLGDALLGSSFTATGAEDASGGSLALWGRAAHSSFDGREGMFSLDGEATTALLGADYARERWLLGLALMQSEGDGGYADQGAVQEGAGAVEASLTAAVPYAALEASERMKLWGAFGHGSGEVTLKPRAGVPLASDISWTMASTGLRSDLLAPPGEEAGLSLALVSDALWARARSDRTDDLAASESDVTRLRLGLEGRWAHLLEDGGHFTPKLELGARHDGGDAETGAGVELGGGLAWSAPALGLNLDLSGRTLLAHGDGDLEDRGFAAALAFDPDPASERGASFHVRQDWGGQAAGGLDALFASDPLDRHAVSGAGGAAESRWTAEAAWGLPAFSGRFTGSPYAGLGLATGARESNLGWRLTPTVDASDVSFGLQAARRESDMVTPEHTVGFEINAQW